MRLELFGEQMLHLACDIDDEAREGPCLLRHGGVAHENAESIGLGLDVLEECHARLLEELSRILPDDTFLGQFNVVDGLVEIEGSTASAAALVPRLEASAMFAAVRFRAPVAAEAVSRRERFHFALELAQR